MYLIDMEWSGYINDWSQFQIIDNAPTVEVNTVIFTKEGKGTVSCNITEEIEN